MPEFLSSVVDCVKNSATVKAVYGDPIVANGRTVIPVARIAYGFGGGSGNSSREGKPGEGEGGGGGLAAIPVGAFEITDTGTRFIPLTEKRKLIAVGMIGLCLGLLCAKRK
ncbi:MAG: hypothetical protein JWO80_221 [Bryobacterales bacterium]|nr:hypothetical protein [Bryobacterales bacterium]